MTKMIGILAGMGPRSTAPFIDRVVDECQRQYGARDDIDFPPMMIYSLPTPFYLDRPIDAARMRRVLTAGVRHLESTGVDFIAMPCNTAHQYYDDMAAAIDVPLLNMIDITLGSRPEGLKQAALLATRPTVATGLYQAGAARATLQLVVEEEWQQGVDAVLGAIDDGKLDQARAHWRDLAAGILAAGLAGAILGCTDLNVVSGETPAALTLLDSSACLAQAVVARWRSAQ